MAITVNSRTTTNALAASGSASFLNGNVGDWQETTINISAEVSFKTSLSTTVTVNTDNTLTLSSGLWSDFGFLVGDSVTGTLNQTQISTGTNTATAISSTIIAISGNVMTLSSAIFATIPYSFVVGGTFGDYYLNWLELKVDRTFTALEFYYNQFLNSNYNSPTLNSVLDGSNTVLTASGLDATDTVTLVSMSLLNPRSGNSVYSGTVRGLGKSSGVSSFEIIILHNISGVYDVTTDITSNVLPSWYLGSECLTDTYQILMLQSIGNPNGSILSELTETQGNTGWFNENRNTGNNLVTVDAVTYTDVTSALTVAGLQSDRNTKVEIEVSTASAFFVELDNLFNVGIVTLPNDRAAFSSNDYTDLENLTANTLGVNQAYNFGTLVASVIPGFTNSYGGTVDVNNYHFEFLTTTTAKITLEVQPDSLMQTYLNDTLVLNDRLFAIWVSCVDSTDNFTAAHRENVLVSGQWVAEEIVQESFKGGSLFEVYPREQDYYTSTVDVNTDIVVEDDFHTAMEFTLDKLERVESVKCGVEIYYTPNGTRTELDSVTVDTSTAPISADSTQELNFEVNRPFNYVDGFKDKLITIQRNSSADSGTDRGFKIIAAMRFRWEWWLSNLSLPTAFYDNTEPLDNLNFEFISKKLNGDFVFRYFQEVTVDGVNYLDTKNLTAYTYNNAETDNYISTIDLYENDDFTGSLYLADKTNKYTGRNFAIIDGQLNYIEAVLTRASTNFIVDYAEVTIEGEDGAGFQSQWKIRTDQTPTSTNPLQPISGETTVKTTAVSGSLTVQCALNPDLLPSTLTNVKITVEYCGTAEGGDGGTTYLTRDLAWGSISEEPTTDEDECLFNECEYTLPVFGSLTSEANYKNDIKGLFKKKNDLVTNIVFNLVDCDGVEYALNDNTYGTYFPFGSFEYEPDAVAYQLRWRDVLKYIGAGCYTIKTTYTLLRGTELSFYSCKFNLLPYECDDVFRTVRIESVQNGYIEDLDINFKGINWLDHLRFEGYFGNQQPIHESTMYVGTNNQKKTNQIDLTSEFSLTSHLVPNECVTAPLWNYHFLATELFISDYNSDNHRRDYKSFPVYLEEVSNVDYFKKNSKAVMSVKFSERVISKRMRSCVGDRPLPYLSDSYVYSNQCPTAGFDVFLKSVFDAGNDEMSLLTIDADNEGTYTAITDDGASGTITVSKNGLAYGTFSNPTVLVAGDTWQVKRTVTTSAGWVKITGTYV